MTGISEKTAIDSILLATADLRSQLLAHPVYSAINTQRELKIFMQHHVFAVYDFMWLLKRLQQDVCSVSVPWFPPANPELSRFINEIVLGEESDEDRRGTFCSHFELYLNAMRDVDASVDQVGRFITQLRSGTQVQDALVNVSAPLAVCDFVLLSHRLATVGSTAEVAAAFCFGREDVIPEMFQRLLDGFGSSKLSVPQLEYYIQRHIELDGDHHGPMTRQMVNVLCPGSEPTMDEAIRAARQAISHRIALWDGVLAELGNSER